MNMKHMRGRQHRSGGGGGGIRHHGGNIPLNRNHFFDSNGPEVRVRGTAQQLFEKYLQRGRDATGSGDRVMAESYFQYAEHYFRILNAMNQAAPENQQQDGEPHQRRPNGKGEDHDGIAAEGDERRENGRVPGTDDQLETRKIRIAAAPPEST
ncbi:MAG TPA: DUF4167 domain-containing protein [Acetobacteraceae bacterium]|nr:DUF4167 domain-containing protein [Acetobacteraceae bacterium]